MYAALLSKNKNIAKGSNGPDGHQYFTVALGYIQREGLVIPQRL